MLTLPPSVRIYLSLQPVDFRKGVDGLCGVVRRVWDEDPLAGHLFVFIGRRADRVKILFWDRGGFVLYYKRLERSRFQVPAVQPGTDRVVISAADLAMLLEGIDFSRVRHPRQWVPRPQDTGRMQKMVDSAPRL